MKYDDVSEITDVNKLISLLEVDFDTLIDKISVHQIQLLIDKCDARYYRPGSSSLLPDHKYDILRRTLSRLAPDDPRLTRVGSPYANCEISSKVTHNIPMGSLDNTDNGVDGYGEWLKWLSGKIGNEFTINASLKVDGSSICASYENGTLKRVATRGNGYIGEDITKNAINFRYLPTVLTKPITIDVRGEAVLYKKDFDTLCESIPQEDQSNPRNLGNGIIGRHDGTSSEYIKFLAFNAYSSESVQSEVDKLDFLKSLGFVTVPSTHCKDKDSFMSFYENILNNRDKLPFEIDGIVVVVNEVEYQKSLADESSTILRPKYAKAVKFPHKHNTTTIESIEISIGHTRALIPTAKLKTVRIGGVNVSSVLLNNYDEVRRLDVAIGDEVEVVLSGDIIPKITKCVNKSTDRVVIAEPTQCPFCGSPTTRLCRGKPGAITYCSNINCSGAIFQKLDHWIGSSKKGVGILEIGGAMIKALWENGLLKDPADLYKLTVDDIKDIQLEKGSVIGAARANKIISNIKSKSQLTLPVFLGSLGIDLLGKRRVEILMDGADGQLNTLEDWLDIDKLNTINIQGFGDTVRSSIVSGISDNIDLIKKLVNNGVTIISNKKQTLPTPPSSNSTSPPDSVSKVEDSLKFSGLSFCFTGTRSHIDDVVAHGGVIKSGVSKGLSILVQLDALSRSTKTQKAEDYGTLVISLDYLKRAIAGDVDLKADFEKHKLEFSK